MNPRLIEIVAVMALVSARSAIAQPPAVGENPADRLPAHITRLTAFGERADWSHDGKRILFLSKTFGDAMEIDLATKSIRNLTAHYHHHGYTRALYLSNGDILLAGPENFDPARPSDARNQSFLYVLDKSGARRPAPLGVRCNEGPAVSRRNLRIAWAEWFDPPPRTDNWGRSQIDMAEIVYKDSTPELANRKTVLDSRTLSFRTTLEAQNFRPPLERELTFSAYDFRTTGADVGVVDLTTGKVTRHTDTTDVYDEPEGIFPDGQATLVESDKQNRQGNTHVDMWRLALDGSGRYERLTFFSDYPGYKASNGVVSDDGRFIAFQLAKSTDQAGVGHGIFIYDVEKTATK
jgi:Tol biopolymer transport system component